MVRRKRNPREARHHAIENYNKKKPPPQKKHPKKPARDKAMMGGRKGLEFCKGSGGEYKLVRGDWRVPVHKGMKNAHGQASAGDRTTGSMASATLGQKDSCRAAANITRFRVGKAKRCSPAIVGRGNRNRVRWGNTHANTRRVLFGASGQVK